MPLLETRNITKHYFGVPVLQGVSVAFEGGAVYGLIGPNGSGKTTLLNVISGFVQPDRGTVFCAGRRVDQLLPEQRWALGMARSFQDNRSALHLTAGQNIGLSVRGQVGEHPLSALLSYRAVSVSNEKTRHRVWALLNDFRLAELIDQVTGTLSYGQQKIIGVLGCIASDPKILLLDEPATGLSPSLKDKVLAMLLSYITATGALAIVVDHDLDFIERISSHVLFMKQGEVIASGPLDQLRQNPEAIAAYLGEAASIAANL
jgi:ABC-type branched-subunit amino acid transport system ATPase component